MTSLSQQKKTLRAQILELRTAARATFGDDAERRLAENVLEALPDVKGKAISVYWPLRSEIGVETLLHGLHDSGALCYLPVVEEVEKPLTFKRWQPDQSLIEGAYGVMTPPEEAEEGTPEIVILPVVAFDEQGGRLGYGGGFYDRTLEILRGNGDILALGAAFSCQRVDQVPTEATDQRLDGIVTEEGVTMFPGAETTGVKEGIE